MLSTIAWWGLVLVHVVFVASLFWFALKQLRRLVLGEEIQFSPLAASALIFQHQDTAAQPNTPQSPQHDPSPQQQLCADSLELEAREILKAQTNEAHRQQILKELMLRASQPLLPSPPTPQNRTKTSALPPVPRSFRQDGTLGCAHYERGNALWCECCVTWFVCRHCHDNYHVTPNVREDQSRNFFVEGGGGSEKEGGGGNKVGGGGGVLSCQSHVLDRQEVKTIGCMMCGCVQGVGRECVNCSRPFARYFCEICKFYDNSPNKNIYHCPHCNICRLGKGLGIDYIHCHKCDVCWSKSSYPTHPCHPNTLHQQCPICCEDLFSSTLSVIFPVPCHHPIHALCWKSHVKFSSVCPVCKTSIKDCSRQFQTIDVELRRLGSCPQIWVVSCKDCHCKSLAQVLFVGSTMYGRCEACLSYNTDPLIQITDKTQLPRIKEEYAVSTNTKKRVRRKSIHQARYAATIDWEATNSNQDDDLSDTSSHGADSVETEFFDDAIGFVEKNDS